MSGFPILMYHRIASPECPVRAAGEISYAVGIDEFAWQLQHLRSEGRRGVSVARIHGTLSRGERVPDNWVGITFDDGNRSDVEHALPMLRDAGFDATFYIGTSRIGARDGLEADMVRRLDEGGMHVASHGVSHRFLTALPAEEEVVELRESRRALEAILGHPVDHFAPPGGRFGRRTLRALNELGYVAVATSIYGLNPPAGASFTYKRIPVVAATGRAHFVRIVSRDARALLPALVRSRTLAALRKAVGESVYRRIRGAAGRS